MSNVLYIRVGTFSMPGFEKQTVVLAADQYSDATMTFDDKEHLLYCYPTQEDLILEVLKLPAFEGGAIIYKDGTYELDSISAVCVEGYPE